MKAMKKTLLGFLTLLMLTPALTCAMAFCPMQAAQAADMPTCHDAVGSGGYLMLALDCMGVDLFQTDVSYDVQPDLSLDSADYAWADLASGYNFKPDNIHGIRGPPDRLDQPNTAASIILTTQRFRI